MAPVSPHGTMKKTVLLAACAALLAGCDFVEGAIEDVDDAIEENTDGLPDPVAFSSLTLVASPLPADEDGSAPDLYVEIQDAGGSAAYRAPGIAEDADEGVFPYVLGGGALNGTTQGYYVVVLDRDADGYDFIVGSKPFTADDLRASASDTFAVANAAGTLRAELVLTR